MWKFLLEPSFSEALQIILRKGLHSLSNNLEAKIKQRFIAYLRSVAVTFQVHAVTDSPWD